MNRHVKHWILFTLMALSLLIVACDTGQPGPDVADLEGTLASQGTLLAQLVTDAAAQEQNDRSQWDAISQLSTQMPLALGLVTPIPPGTTIMPTILENIESPTPYAVCTPPACAPDEMYFCPGECLGGCGTTCATATPGASTGFGEVWGELCYPGEGIPPMTLYFYNINTQEILRHPNEEGQSPYRVELPDGVYVAFAWLNERLFALSYTQYVRCGFDDHCTDHSLVPFLVRAGSVTTGVDICDWQMDKRSLPPLTGG
jgi:hypothetical protein